MSQSRIILFRGMNTGGVRAPVAELRHMATTLGLKNPRTLAASGNLVVESDHDPVDLEAMIEAAMVSTFGLNIAALVRTPQQWSELINTNPFAAEARERPNRVLAMVMKTDARAGGAAEVSTFARGGEQLQQVRLPTGGTVIYMDFPDGQGASVMAEKATPARIGLGTGRNWNTVLKLAQMVSG